MIKKESKFLQRKLGMVVYDCNPSTHKFEASLGRLACLKKTRMGWG
jgi:hypothetical protein